MVKKWFRLDNAALIFPAVRSKKWSNAFRMSVTLTESVDPALLAQAVRDIQPRFPSMFVKLRSGVFWHYLKTMEEPLSIQEDYAYPLTHMNDRELRHRCLRVLYYDRRIAVEVFHSVTDGKGGMVLLQNVTARYLELKYGIQVPCEYDIVDWEDEATAEELQDCFLLCSGSHPKSRQEATVYRLHGIRIEDGFRRLTTGVVPSDRLLETARDHKATVTAFLAAVMAEAVQEIQRNDRPQRAWRPVKITVPVNLRRLFDVHTLRNFSLTVNVGFHPKEGEYSFDQICDQMTHQLAAEVVPQKMASRIATNVKPQQNLLMRFAPLPVKILAMRGVYADIGERKGCLNISNMGEVKVPAVMTSYISRVEAVAGVQRSYPHNCAVVSYDGHTYINLIGNIESVELERLFFSKLVALGVPVDIESNERR